MWHAAECVRQIQTSIDHIITGPEHQCIHAGHSGNLLDVLNSLDGLDLRDDAYMVVTCRNVVAVVRVERLAESGRECPWTERAVAQGCCD